MQGPGTPLLVRGRPPRSDRRPWWCPLDGRRAGGLSHEPAQVHARLRDRDAENEAAPQSRAAPLDVEPTRRDRVRQARRAWNGRARCCFPLSPAWPLPTTCLARGEIGAASIVPMK